MLPPYASAVWVAAELVVDADRQYAGDIRSVLGTSVKVVPKSVERRMAEVVYGPFIDTVVVEKSVSGILLILSIDVIDKRFGIVTLLATPLTVYSTFHPFTVSNEKYMIE